MNLQIIKINWFYKIILIKSYFRMLLKFCDIGIQPDRFTQIKGMADIIIAKHRNGPTGTVELAFTREFTRFDNLYRSE